MKILYVVPGIMSKTDLGTAELERRRDILQSQAGKDVQVDIADIEYGPSSIESYYEEFLAVPGTVKRIVQAEKEGYDGAILGCFGDPGIDAVREMISFPVAGPGEISMLSAAMLGNRFSIVTVTDSVIPSLERQAKVIGIETKLASVRAVNIPVLELRKNIAASKRKILEEARKAIKNDRADVIIPGCMSMAFLGISHKMQEELGIPVINPALITLKILEGLISCRLTHSKKAYPFPPKSEKQIGK